jgi:hypothetical protein
MVNKIMANIDSETAETKKKLSVIIPYNKENKIKNSITYTRKILYDIFNLRE